MKHDSKQDTQDHIAKVKSHIDGIIMELARRSIVHDASKLEEPEKSIFDEVTPRLAGMTYGSEEYDASLAEMKPALDHHYASNEHHPEHNANGMAGMTIVDLVEMFCDWCAATERHDDGNIGKSIDHNMQRFGYGETLASIFVNTAQLYCMGRRNHVAYRHKDYSPHSSTDKEVLNEDS